MSLGGGTKGFLKLFDIFRTVSPFSRVQNNTQQRKSIILYSLSELYRIILKTFFHFVKPPNDTPTLHENWSTYRCVTDGKLKTQFFLFKY